MYTGLSVAVLCVLICCLKRKPDRCYPGVSTYRLWGRELTPINGGQHAIVESLIGWDLRFVAIPAYFVEATCFNDRDGILRVFG